jgi:hypothetical protein
LQAANLNPAADCRSRGWREEPWAISRAGLNTIVVVSIRLKWSAIMAFLTDLGVAILVISIVLFFASYVAWTVLPHHFGDWRKLERENELMDAIKRWNVPAGSYMFPRADSKKEMNQQEFMRRYQRGPRGIVHIWKMPNIAANLGLTFLFFFVTTAIIGYVTHIACPPGASGVEFVKVFRIAGTTGILTHASSGVLNSIWFKRRIIMDVLDGIVYGLLIGLIFALMWPYSG